jgi:small conductance mechanosensitive channel
LGVRIVVGAYPPAQADDEATADPAAGVAAPSACASSTSPQSLAASPIAPPNLSK